MRRMDFVVMVGYIPSNEPFDIHGNNTCVPIQFCVTTVFSVNFYECTSDRPYRFTLRARLQGDLYCANITFWISALVPHGL